MAVNIAASVSLKLRPAAAYGVLGLPLAFAALPVYVHVPKLYGDALGLPLATVGAVLLASRIVDAVTDPLIGWGSDRIARRRILVGVGLPLLALGLVALMMPPGDAGPGWLMLAVLLASFGYSLATINYHAWGAELARDENERTLVVAMREGFGLAGVVLAASLPGLVGGDERSAMAWLAWVFVPVMLLAWAINLRFAPGAPGVRASTISPWRTLADALRNPDLRRLLMVFAVNGIAAALPSATVLFFVADVLRAEAYSGLFLAVYFLCAALGLPLWVALARRWGKVSSWAASMLLAVLVFAWASTLGEGDLWAFAAICLLSGMALGADLTMPPALLADLLARRPGEARGGTWFGLWNFVSKANLALAAGLGLPLLALLGYSPGSSGAGGVAALSVVYGLLPVLLKLAAMALLWRWRRLMQGEPG